MKIALLAALLTATVSVQAQAPAASVTVPAGTVILVRMMDSISSQSPAGTTFTTKLETNLMVNGAVAVPAGTVVYGKVQSSTQAGRAVGKSTLDIRLSQIVPQGTPVPIMTSSYKQAGEGSGKKTAKAAAAGAIIGNNANGGGNGGEGAAIGAGVAMLKPGQTLTIPPGSLLEFTLEQPVALPAH